MKPTLLACLISSLLCGFLPAGEESDSPKILFLFSKDKSNYEAHRTIPKFAAQLHETHGWNTEVIEGKGPLTAFSFPGLEAALLEADVLVVFFRRVALPPSQLDAIKTYLAEGGSLVGIRTANHAFSVRNEAAEDGFKDWWDFVPEYLGHENRGYGEASQGTAVTAVQGRESHEILEGVTPLTWHSKGSLYLVSPLVDNKAVPLLIGSVGDNPQPVAWTRLSQSGGRVFYTSLGYPEDFDSTPFPVLLRNGLAWTARVSPNQSFPRKVELSK